MRLIPILSFGISPWIKAWSRSRARIIHAKKLHISEKVAVKRMLNAQHDCHIAKHDAVAGASLVYSARENLAPCRIELQREYYTIQQSASLLRTKFWEIFLHQVSTQRVGPLSELSAVLQGLGADVYEVFEGSGVDPWSVKPDLRMGFPELLDLLERAARISGCPHIGLLFGLRFEVVKHHGIIGELMHSAPTLKQAFVDCVTWQLGYSSGAIVYLNQLDDEYAFGYGTYEVSSQGTRVLYDVIVCIAARMVHELSGGKAKVVEAHFAHSGSADSATYERLLRLPVRFNQNRTGVLVKA